MSMELWIFSDRQVNSIAEWQAAIEAEGYPLQLSPEVDIEELSGFCPMHLNGELTGFECYRDDASEFMQNYPNVNFGRPWKHVLGFRWLGSHINELRAAWMAATAYAQAADGVIVDDQELKIHTPARARGVVSEVERDFL